MSYPRLAFLAVALCLVYTSGSAAALTLHVDASGCTGSGTGSAADPFCTIQQAICELHATGGGTAQVHPGTYNESLRMLPGVSVVATDGPEVTTIDATGRPCTTSACEASAVNLTCAAVVWGSGSTQADRLEGFRITGGSGLRRAFGDGSSAVTGGGIVVFNSSPTITRNVIADNALFDKNTEDFWGGGIYLGGGSYNDPTAPVITDNLIENNLAIPDRGSSAPPSLTSYGLGGGIYVGANTAPIITGNVIRANQAGDDRTGHSGGGGIASYAVSPESSPFISRNVIRGNTTYGHGGGLMFGYFLDGVAEIPSRGTVANNLIDQNTGATGGGLLTQATAVELLNNTIVDNSAGHGGGIALYSSSASEPALVNNIVAFNSATEIEGGGALIMFTTPDVFAGNDLFGNLPEEIAGDKTTADYVGLDGNVSIDPSFVSRSPGTRNLALLPGSVLIDAGVDSDTPGPDLFDAPRIVDGTGDGTAVIDVGAVEFQGGADADADGVENSVDNCPSIGNPAQDDMDGDGLGDACDPDDDNDGVDDGADPAPLDAASCGDLDGDTCDDCVGGTPDPWDDGPDFDLDGQCDAGDADDDGDGVADSADCAALTPGVHSRPAHVGDSLRFDLGGGATLGWAASAYGHTYNVYRGSIDRQTPWSYDAACLAVERTTTEAQDSEDPPEGTAFYYVVAARNACGESALGNATSGSRNGISTCATAVRDSDGDGITDIADNCPMAADASQADRDLDGIGDACDLCDASRGGTLDADGVCRLAPGGPPTSPDTGPGQILQLSR